LVNGLVDLTVESGIAEIRFNRPGRLNALDIDLAEHFAAAVDSVLNDQSVRVVVISGAGRASQLEAELECFVHLSGGADFGRRTQCLFSKRRPVFT